MLYPDSGVRGELRFLRSQKGGPRPVRTEVTRGWGPAVPVLDSPFLFFSEPLDNPAAQVRAICTSPVREIAATPTGYILTTQNSVYELVVTDNQ